MDDRPATTVGAYDAKTRFSELLERAESGEEFVITRHGTAVARLSPMTPIASETSRRAAIAEMRQLAAQQQLGGVSIKELIAEGRR